NRSWSKQNRAQAGTSPGTRSRVPSRTDIRGLPHMYANLRSSENSFVPVGATVWGPAVLVVHPSLPVNTVTEFVDHVRKNRGLLNWAITAIGSSQYLGMAISFSTRRSST